LRSQTTVLSNMRSFEVCVSLVAGYATLSHAIELDITNTGMKIIPNSMEIANRYVASIKSAASTVAYGLMKLYTGNVTNTPETIAVLPAPLYWWEAGAMWGAMLDYYHLTNDSSYTEVTTQALLSQMGPDSDYMMPNHQKDEGNDDQSFWGFAIMSAAEKNYPQPTIGNYSWLQLTENLWNTQVARWNTSQCGGGLKWQIFSFNSGYTYKNSISNGAFFQLSARLARFTGNQTYYDWAVKSFQWAQDIGLIETSNYMVWDGADDTKNCSVITREVWTYNAGVYLYGSAMMYNYTNGSSLWLERTQGFLNATAYFFNPTGNATNIMYEPPCEMVNTCNNDQFSFKGYLSRFMWASSLVAPFTATTITTLLTATALAAARACSGGDDGETCGQHYYWDIAYDGSHGAGQQMSALETIQGLLAADSIPPLYSDQVSLMVASTTSQAPVPTDTVAPATTRAVASGAGDQGSASMWMTLGSVSLALWGVLR
jgi:mannan endo-1,6-alpha-mannosidase